MKKGIGKWYAWGAVFSIVLGTLLHFIYEWSGENAIVGVFAAVNESTWEHLKLLFWPALIFSVVEYFMIGKDYDNYIYAKAVSLYAGIALIISLFYTYSGIIGKHILAVDIAIFILSILISQYIGYKLTVSPKPVSKIVSIISILAIVVLAIAFVVFTFQPPHIPLFQNPLSGGYGIE